ncbi:sigma-70 family RNA polymerase sigma factor [Pseudorhodoferax sp.]|uniref:sigma-70 family RNA polymerase sigma factor n=1 Tax=Pseudorhodoferax sp. TaxID=1993553 RepID=UPI002DD62302|nr:sigma-70 family RNA polymerase sigma factor [Pseudorhodoferax sp.]
MANAHHDDEPPHSSGARAHLRVVPQEGAAAQQQILAWMQAVTELADRNAFAQLFGHYAPRVKGYLIRSGSEACQAEEIAQETLLVLWRKAAQFDAAQASVGTWLFTIARNLRVDRLRCQGATTVHAQESELHDVADESVPVEERMHTAQLCARMRAALRTMPAEQARVLRLCYFEDQPHTSIASTLGLPLGTVKSRMRAALVHLRRALQDGGLRP